MIRNIRMVCIFFLVVPLLAACAVRNAATLPTVTPLIETSMPIPQPILDISCDNIAALDNWIQIAGITAQDVRPILENLDGLDPLMVSDRMYSLNMQREHLTSYTRIPNCAREAHYLLLDTLDRASDAMRAYARNDIDTLTPILDELLEDLDLFDSRLAPLEVRRNHLLFSTPTPE